MRIEHIAMNLPKPVEAAKWYCEHLGLKCVKGSEEPPYAHFLADEAGAMLEIYLNDSAPVPDYGSADPLVLHIAFEVDDVPAKRDELVEAGAATCGDITVTPAGDELAMLRDPWGVAVQLVKRAEPLR